MKKISIFLFLTAGLCVLSFAQKAPAVGAVKPEQKPAKQEVRVSTSAVSLPPGAPEQKDEKAAEKKNARAKEKAQEEDEYAEVMVDTADPDAYRPAYFAEEKDEKKEELSLPYLYGALKGSFNDGGKNVLVFENEDGIITFVQVFLDKNAVSWKYLNQISRN